MREQATGQAELSFDDPVVEHEQNVPALLVSFVDGLSHEGREECDAEGGGHARGKPQVPHYRHLNVLRTQHLVQVCQRCGYLPQGERGRE